MGIGAFNLIVMILLFIVITLDVIDHMDLD